LLPTQGNQGKIACIGALISLIPSASASTSTHADCKKKKAKKHKKKSG
jgi:hypothetical protein